MVRNKELIRRMEALEVRMESIISLLEAEKEMSAKTLETLDELCDRLGESHGLDPVYAILTHDGRKA